MFGRSVTLGRILGIPVRVDASWVLIAVLVTWSLAVGYFPQVVGVAGGPAWAMAVAGALGLFLSILFHEFAHAVAARRFGVRVRSVTLFLFGGVGDLAGEPPTPTAEFWIAVAGPASSTLLALLLAPFVLLADRPLLPLPVHAVLHWLLLINVVLAVFNLVPAFPLDGGRVLRALLWRGTGSLRRATRTAAGLGRGFGLFLMVLGGFQFLGGNWIGGVWLFCIGLWLRQAARGSWSQLMLKEHLRGEPVRAFMKGEPVTVPATLTVDRFVEDYLYPHHYKMFPVVDDGRLLGCVTLRAVTQVEPADRARRTVGEILLPLSGDNAVAPDADVLDALGLMNRTGNGRLLVAAEGRLLGILTLKDIMGFFALKIELEGEGR